MSEAKQIETVYHIINNAKDMIALAYKPEDKAYCQPSEDITDEKVQDYYYTLNDMCSELLERDMMRWQQEDDDED